MSIGADGAEYCVKYWRIGAGVSIEYRFHTNPASEARQQKMRSDGNYFPPGRKVLTEGLKEAAAGGPQ